MSMNIHHSLEKVDNLRLMQIGTDDSYRIYGEGNHLKIVDRLEEYYMNHAKMCLQYEAERKGDKHPFQGKDRKYWNKQLQEYQAEIRERLFDKLRKIPASEIEWSVW